MAQKKTTKSKRRLKRNVRKTMGTICLIASLLVASVPVNSSREAEASVSTSGGETIYSSDLTWEKQIEAADSSVIPLVETDEPIYSTSDGTFQFAVIDKSSSDTTQVAIILGYTGGTLANNTLTIPDTVSAYANLSSNSGSASKVAVSVNGMPLYYISTESTEIMETRIITETVTDEDGNETEKKSEVEVGTSYYSLPTLSPCYADEIDDWGSLDLSQFYYLDDTASDKDKIDRTSLQTESKPDTQKLDNVITDSSLNVYCRTKDSTDQWIKDIKVVYIGNQTLTKNSSSTDSGLKLEYQVSAETRNIDPEEGIFAGESNIYTLNIGQYIEGIGNFAFYGCTGLQKVSIGNGLREIGTKAFMNCNNLTSVTLDMSCPMTYISDYCFANCGRLQSFDLPLAVQVIYDHAFDGCTSMNSLNLMGTEDMTGMALKQLGFSVFKNCEALEEIIFPDSFTGDHAVNINNFEGCTALKHIVVNNKNMSFEGKTGTENKADYTTYEIDTFKDEVDSTFYFEGPGTSQVHEFTKANGIAFKYSEEDKYEIIVTEDTGAKLTYQVNSSNQLTGFYMDESGGTVEEVTIPSSIGPYGISAIDSGSFTGNCSLKKITIPASVTAINENAFKGCHNLKHVIFENAATITTIGDGAFATQVVSAHQTSCANQTLESTCFLSFTGTVGSSIVPFTYAMDGSNNINTGSQPLTYITYYSGWPTNLTIQFVPDDDNSGTSTHTGKATLVDYPTYSELATFAYYSATSQTYPYMTESYSDAAEKAITDYELYLAGTLTTTMTQDEWNIINAAINPVIPSGVKAVKTGLFNGATVTEGDDGTYTVTRSTDESGSTAKADTKLQTVTFEDLDEYTPYMFDGCTNLTSIKIDGGTAKIDEYAFAQYNDGDTTNKLASFTMATNTGSSIGDYAFDNCDNLTSVTISSTVSTLGKRPFSGCTSLTSGNVSFSGGPYYTESDGIIYELDDAGNKVAIVQCLESKSGSALKVTDSTITSMYDEAFANCDKIGKVDLSGTSITKISTSAFEDTDGIYSVTLPSTAVSIGSEAFHDSSIQLVENIPDTLAVIASNAFDTADNLPTDGESALKTITFVCSEDALAARAYADLYDNIVCDTVVPDQYWTVRFIAQDEDGNMYDYYEEQEVLDGNKAWVPEIAPTLTGYTFSGWYTAVDGVSIDEFDMNEVHQDLTFQARFTAAETTYTTVRFLDLETGEELAAQQKVIPGECVVAPSDPTKDGYTFSSWTPSIDDPIPEVTEGSYYDFYAIWTVNGTETTTVRFLDLETGEELCARQTVAVGSYVVEPNSPTKSGYTFSGWSPSIEDPIPSVTAGSFYDFYAIWTSNSTETTTVRFLDLETGEELCDRQTVNVGSYAVAPNAPTKDGYTFSGWSPSLDDPIPAVTEGSYYDVYALWTANADTSKTVVRFLDMDTGEEVANRQTVAVGDYIVEPVSPTKDGYTFNGWYPSLDTAVPEVEAGSYYDVYAKWIANATLGKTTTVRFLDLETLEEIADRQTVTVGAYATTPTEPTKEGYTFSGWSPSLSTQIPEVADGSYYDIYAIWTANSSSNSDDTTNTDDDNSGTTNTDDNSGTTNTDDNSGTTTDDNSNNSGTTQTTTATTLYTLTVQNGMGSGSYAAGAQAIIIANDPATGQEFSYWSVDSGDVTLPSTSISATVLTMPAGNVTVTAHYKEKSTTTTSTGSGTTTTTGSSGSTNTPSTVSSSGTTVVIDKNGLSNTGVVSATVNGSSDNFTVKVSESSTATEAVVKALMAQFGTDLTNIKYFPMDISLYDATGTTEITDTTGLSVSITLPIPDSLIEYAGNNKVACVVNGSLESLTPKFTTIDGVACVTFTAQHFSPYVIYADTENLTASTISDSTPKTGDIHPKWFLSFGLACISVVLFLKKDKKQVPVKARA